MSIILLATIYDIFKRVKLHFKNANKQEEEVNTAVVAEGSFLIVEQEKKLTKKGFKKIILTVDLSFLKRERDFIIFSDRQNLFKTLKNLLIIF